MSFGYPTGYVTTYFPQQQQQPFFDLGANALLSQKTRLVDAVEKMMPQSAPKGWAEDLVQSCKQFLCGDDNSTLNAPPGVSLDLVCALTVFTAELPADMRRQEPASIVNRALRNGDANMTNVSDYLLYLLSALSMLSPVEEQKTLYRVVPIASYSKDELNCIHVGNTLICREFVRLYSEEAKNDMVKETYNPVVFSITVNHRVFDVSAFSLNREETFVLPPGTKLMVLDIVQDNDSKKKVVAEVTGAQFPLNEAITWKFCSALRPFRSCLQAANFWGNRTKADTYQSAKAIERQCKLVLRSRYKNSSGKHLPNGLTEDEALALIALTLDYGAALAHKTPLAVLNKGLSQTHFPANLSSFMMLLLSALEKVRVSQHIEEVYSIELLPSEMAHVAKSLYKKTFTTAYKTVLEAEDFYGDTEDAFLIKITGDCVAYDLSCFTQTGDSLVVVSPMTTFACAWERNLSGRPILCLRGSGTDQHSLTNYIRHSVGLAMTQVGTVAADDITAMEQC